jgi:hypothetical protein
VSKQPKFSATIVNPTSTNDEGNPIGVNLDNFYSLMRQTGYIFVPCRDLWPRASVDARLGKQPVLNNDGTPRRDKSGNLIYETASKWLDKNRPVEAMSWAPGLPLKILDRLISNGGWIKRKGVSCFNLYRPPLIELSDATKAGPWLDHMRTVFNADDAAHIVKWLAHRVQRPGDKINHALVLGGEQGIGKDSMLEPVKEAVGRWNFQEITPKDLLGRFNPFVESVILRINEVHDLGEFDRFKLYDRAKLYTAAPPDVLRVDKKHVHEYYVPNVSGILFTTNHKTDGIYLPAGDRRHYVAWSDRKKEDFPPSYWNTLWAYYADGGFGHVAAYLTEFDLSGFDPKAPPPKTPVFWEIVNVNCPPEEAELADVIDALGAPDPNNPNEVISPDAVTVPELIAAATGEISEWLINRGNRRSLPHRLQRCGYTAVANPDRQDKLWKCKSGRLAIYARVSLSTQEQITAAKKKAQS